MQSSAVTVRSVSADDLPVLRDNEAIEGSVDEHFTDAEQGNSLYFAAFDGDEPLGTAVLDLRPVAYQPQLRNMWVYPSARRRGAGRALSTYADEAAREQGFTEVFLAVDPNNEKAIPLYVSLNYAPIGEHIFVEDPEEFQVSDPNLASDYYAVYRKSLLERS